MHKKNNPYESYMRQSGQQGDAPTSGAKPAPEEPPFESFFGTDAAGLFAGDPGMPPAEGPDAGADGLSDESLYAMCAQRICPGCPQKKEAENARLRAFAELDNAQKRLKREKEECIRFAGENVLSDILPSLDNLDIALQHAAPDEACKNFVVGVEMTRRLLLEALKKHGLEMVGAVGEVFDPARHEAVGMADVPEIEDGAVCALLSPGYVLRDRLLRPARVTVCRRS